MPDDPTKPSEELIAPEHKEKKPELPKKLSQLISIVRIKLRDFPELNRLIEGYETSDKEIALAAFEAIDDFNTTPPILETYTLETFPSMSLLIRGTLIYVIESVGLLQTRNHMVYSDGQGVQVSVSDKTPQLLQWLTLFSNQFETKKIRLKKALNLRGALNLGGLSSEYRYIDGLWEDF